MIFDKKQVRNRIFFLIARAFIVSSIAFISSLYFAHRLQAVSNSLFEQKKLSLILENRIHSVESLNESYAMIGNNTARIKHALFSVEDNIFEFIGTLEGLADKYGLTQTVRFSNPVSTQNPTISIIDYSITLNGNIFTLLRYLSDFELLPYFTSITGFSIHSDQTGWTTDSSITLTARVYGVIE